MGRSTDNHRSGYQGSSTDGEQVRPTSAGASVNRPAERDPYLPAHRVFRIHDSMDNVSLGVVAEGCEFSSGVCVVNWRRPASRTDIHTTIQDLRETLTRGQAIQYMEWRMDVKWVAP